MNGAQYVPLWISLLLLFHSCGEQAGDVAPGYTMQPDTVKVGMNRVKMFRSLPNDSNEIIMLGDSHMQGFHWSEHWNDPNVKNRGIGGDITKGVLRRLGEVLDARPLRVHIQIGVNDIFRGFDPDSVFLNYERILTRLRSQSPGTEVIVHSILPTTIHVMNTEVSCIERSRPLNLRLRALCAEMRIRYVDLTPAFEVSGGLNPAYDLGDGLHLNVAGYRKWCELIGDRP